MIFHDFNEKVKYILDFYNTFYPGTIFNFILASFYHANAHSKIFTKYYSRKRFILVGREVSLNKNIIIQKYLVDFQKNHDFPWFSMVFINSWICKCTYYFQDINILQNFKVNMIYCMCNAMLIYSNIYYSWSTISVSGFFAT